LTETVASASLEVTADGPVRLVTMTRPEQLNAFDEPLHTAVLNIWAELHKDEDARVVVLTGQGRAFSAGGDIKGFERSHEDLALRRRQQRDTLRLIKEMLSFPLPVIAAVNGPAVGLGCSVVGLCDLVLMSSKSYLADPHVPVGLVAADGTAATFPFMTSMLRVKEYLFTGERIRAEDAERLGLANRVVEPDDLMDEALALAHRLAEQPAVALQDTKRALNLHLLASVERILPFALAAQSESFATDEVTASIERFKK
jgi:enoyl-CoA hydratase